MFDHNDKEFIQQQNDMHDVLNPYLGLTTNYDFGSLLTSGVTLQLWIIKFLSLTAAHFTNMDWL